MIDEQQDDPRIEALQAQVASLQRTVNDLMGMLSSVQHPLKNIFLASRSGANFQEQRPTAGSGTPTPWTEARNGTITSPGESAVILEARNGNEHTYYEIIKDCSVITSIELLGDGTEGLEAANTAVWPSDTANPAPLDLWVVTRVGYFETGTETLFAYVRRLRFNKCGNLYAVLEETRYAIDVPEDCTP